LDSLDDDAAVYKSAGALMIQVKDVDGLKKELDERAEELEVKSTSYSRHEESLKKTVDELKEELTMALGQAQPGGDQIA
jgi:prefoldin beta subunit